MANRETRTYLLIMIGLMVVLLVTYLRNRNWVFAGLLILSFTLGYVSHCLRQRWRK